MRTYRESNDELMLIFMGFLLIISIFGIISNIINLNNLYEPEEYNNLGEYTLTFDRVDKTTFSYYSSSSSYVGIGKWFVVYRGIVDKSQVYYDYPYRFYKAYSAYDHADKNPTISVTSYQNPKGEKTLVLSNLHIENHLKGIKTNFIFTIIINSILLVLSSIPLLLAVFKP
ncbi:MAG: hypothetical protein R3Y12_04110 [Clostridia bacterium]